ncbi:MAG: alpha-galactosidase [Eubacteriales bacterium]|nr:alpha-galactosidase [Eubacteriales bacterium]
MITDKNNFFKLDTNHTTYLFHVLESGHLEHLYYGRKIRCMDEYRLLQEPHAIGMAYTVAHDQEDTAFCLDTLNFEASGVGKGDFREPLVDVVLPNASFTTDFLYHSHTITDGKPALTGLPASYGEADDCQTLEITLRDAALQLDLILSYTAFPACDVIARSSRIVNHSCDGIKLRRAMSLQLDLPDKDYTLVTFDGNWGRERRRHDRPLEYGISVNDSKTGNSSSRHNPFVMLRRENCTESSGDCMGFNLVYSGNHAEIFDVSTYDRVRVLTGINPFAFGWELKPGDSFQTPEALLSFSTEGLNGLSRRFQRFANDHIVRGEWKNRERPVLINNWEATYFDFDEDKLVAIAEAAAPLGVELFVLDDGWFGVRNDDTTSLGDWFVNMDKLTHGLHGVCQRVLSLGMQFGLWVEPEMISEVSELCRKHPDWAVRVPGRTPSLGRNQMILDYSNPAVCDYIVDVLSQVFSSCQLSYVKWDMNRNMSDVYSAHSGEGEFYHRYMLGLYGVMERLTTAFPHILFESCAGGGNRFDLGMLHYMPQNWTSDDTDARERLEIQRGTSYGYPLSAMTCHVSVCPNHQTGRTTPISTRFNVAQFGVLGYELDLTQLSPDHRKAVTEQISFYKEHRKLLQFGDFYRFERPEQENAYCWMVVAPDQSEALMGYYRVLTQPNRTSELLIAAGLADDKLYDVDVIVQPMHLDEGGQAVFCGNTEKDHFCAYGDILTHAGFRPKQASSSHYGNSDAMRLMGDFSSRLYYFKAKKQ